MLKTYSSNIERLRRNRRTSLSFLLKLMRRIPTWIKPTTIKMIRRINNVVSLDALFEMVLNKKDTGMASLALFWLSLAF
jgi:hypothetical protein